MNEQTLNGLIKAAVHMNRATNDMDYGQTSTAEFHFDSAFEALPYNDERKPLQALNELFSETCDLDLNMENYERYLELQQALNQVIADNGGTPIYTLPPYENVDTWHTMVDLKMRYEPVWAMANITGEIIPATPPFKFIWWDNGKPVSFITFTRLSEARTYAKDTSEICHNRDIVIQDSKCQFVEHIGEKAEIIGA